MGLTCLGYVTSLREVGSNPGYFISRVSGSWVGASCKSLSLQDTKALLSGCGLSYPLTETMHQPQQHSDLRSLTRLDKQHLWAYIALLQLLVYYILDRFLLFPHFQNAQRLTTSNSD